MLLLKCIPDNSGSFISVHYWIIINKPNKLTNVSLLSERVSPGTHEYISCGHVEMCHLVKVSAVSSLSSFHWAPQNGCDLISPRLPPPPFLLAPPPSWDYWAHTHQIECCPKIASEFLGWVFFFFFNRGVALILSRLIRLTDRPQGAVLFPRENTPKWSSRGDNRRNQVRVCGWRRRKSSAPTLTLTLTLGNTTAPCEDPYHEEIQQELQKDSTSGEETEFYDSASFSYPGGG